MGRWIWRSNMAAVQRAVKLARDGALGDASEYVLETANRTAPIEESTLIRSGATDVDDGKAAVSYDTVYAVIQHERMDFRHDPGRRPKWLEQTVTEERRAIQRALANGMRRRLP